MKSDDYANLNELFAFFKEEIKHMVENETEEETSTSAEKKCTACQKEGCLCGNKEESCLKENVKGEDHKFMFGPLELTFAKDGELDVLNARYNKTTKQMQILTTSNILINNCISTNIKQEINIDLSAVDIDPESLDVYTTTDPGTVTVTGRLIGGNDSQGIVEIFD